MYIGKSSITKNERKNYIIKGNPLVNSLCKKGKFYEVSPFDQGFTIIIHENRKHYPANHTDNICLINQAHNNNPTLLIHELVETIPSKFRLLAGEYLYAQTPLLRLLAEIPAAEQLAETSPHLLWIIAVFYYKNQLSIEQIKTFLGLKLQLPY